MDSNLQFDQAEFSAPATMKCGACQAPLSGEYYQARGMVLCAGCAEGARNFAAGEGSRAGRFSRATLFGVGAAIVGGLVYWGVLVFAEYELALLSIGIGWLVGKAVRKGSGERGGWRYQLIAAFLTYTSIIGAYFFAYLQNLGHPTIEQVLGLAIIAYGIPFMQGFQNILGILIIAFGVWQAWQLNRGISLEVTGPHAITAGQPLPAPNAGV